MNQKQADFLETTALTVEANPDFYDQSAIPVKQTDTSCGCLIHMMKWIGKIGRPCYDSSEMQELTGLVRNDLFNILTWNCKQATTASEGAAYLRTYIPENLK